MQPILIAENGFESVGALNISDEQELINIGIEDKYHRNALLREIQQINIDMDPQMSAVVSADVDCIVLEGYCVEIEPTQTLKFGEVSHEQHV